MLCLGLIMSLVCTVESYADVIYTWEATTPGADWQDAANWNPDGLPIYSGISGQRDTAGINTLTGPTLYSGTAGAWAVEVGYAAGSAGQLDLVGGSLQAPGGLDVGFTDATCSGILNISGGNHSARYLVAGRRGTGTVTMYDGFFRVTNTLRVAYYGSGVGRVNLNGGTLSIKGFYMPYDALVVIDDGTLLYDGDVTAIDSYLYTGGINVGKLVAAAGKTLQVEYDSALLQTRVTAVPEPVTLVLLATGALGFLRKRK